MKTLAPSAALLILVSAACSAGVPSASVTPSPGTSVATTSPATSPALSTPTPAPPTTATAAPTPTLAETAPPATTPAAGGTTWTLVMADGPREGTWEVSAPGGEVAACQYLPDLDRWLATWLGPPPLSFIDPRGDDDPSLLFTFTEEDETELSFLPTGEVTFEADDRGDTATLTWVSESHEGDRFDSAGNNLGSIEVGQATLTIECGSIFRYP